MNKEHPILMSTEMVKAILDGRKTQTRRVVTKNNSFIGEDGDWSKLAFYGKHTWNDDTHCMKEPYIAETWVDNSYHDFKYLHVPYDFENMGVIYRVYPRYNPKDILWVKETWYQGIGCDKPLLGYKADGDFPHGKEYMIKPSIFMPRKYSRITLKITNIRVQRLQEISHEDITAEGLGDGYTDIGWNYAYGQLWNKLNEKRGYGWSTNPWVWAISFKRIK